MSDYEQEQFERDDNLPDEKKHQLRLSVDLLSVKDFKISANISIEYILNLLKSHSFKSSPPSAVNQGHEVKLLNSFATYEFTATKSELFTLLNDVNLAVKIMHTDKSGSSSEVGQAIVQVQEILQAPLKNTPQAVVRVSDQFLPIKDTSANIKGLIRCILYLEDLGEVVGAKKSFQNISSKGQENKSPNRGMPQQDQDYQAVWQLEMWKRAEEAKFKAYLKQREIERIEEITMTWKAKEAERDKTFTDCMLKITQFETKLRQKALDLQRREERIIQLEEELKHKIQEVSRQLTVKEEEIMNVKKRFKEEKVLLEQDKKKLTLQLEEFKSRVENAENKFYGLKKEVDESPLSILRADVGQKNLEIIELDNKLKLALDARDEFKVKFEQVKRDMINLKKIIDQDKSNTLVKQAEELENLKNTLRNKQAQDDERKELTALRIQLSTIQNKLSENKTGGHIPETINDRAQSQGGHSNRQGTYNPLYQQSYPQQSQQNAVSNQSNVFLDNFARQHQSPIKDSQKQQMSKLSFSSEIDRLLKEKTELLSEGLYSNDDPLIIELDRQIRACQLRGTS